MKPLTHFSASQLKRIRTCPLQWYYYHEGAEKEEVDSCAMDCGSRVHAAIEAAVNGEEPSDLSGEVDRRMRSHYERCVQNYQLLDIPPGGTAEVEMEAEVCGLILTGRMDYVVGNRIYDWKTGKPRPDDYIQAAVYQRLAIDNGIHDPEVIFVHLSSGTMRTMPDYPKDLVDALVQSALDVINAKAYMPRYGAWCKNCPYTTLCQEAYP